MIEQILEYLKDTYKITLDDLDASESHRLKLLGKLELIEEIEDIIEKGIPNATK